MMVIAVMTTPIASTWSNASILFEAGSVVQQAYTRARTLAISNPYAVSNGQVSVVLCSKGDTLYVQKGLPLLCGVDYQWSTRAGTGISLEYTHRVSELRQFNCIALDSLGLPVPAFLDGVDCTIETDFRLRKGDLVNAIQLY
jgi:hypothetical protein